MQNIQYQRKVQIGYYTTHTTVPIKLSLNVDFSIT